jgi:outer membrane protein assembly factor BamE (lipoprotein component of BamABCDE complex)
LVNLKVEAFDAAGVYMVVRRVLTRGLVVGALLSGIAGCVGGDNGQQAITDESKISQIRKGVTTKTDIQVLFGQPSGRNFAENGEEQWSYAYISSHVDPKTYIPIVGAFTGGATVKTSALTVTFGKDGIVKAYGVNNMGASSGFSKM